MKHIEKKPNLAILNVLKSQKFPLSTMVTNIQPSLKNIFSYPSGATGPKLIILWPCKQIIVLVSIISTFVKVVYLS